MYPGEHARTHPDQPALIMATSGEQLTFAEYEANCNRLAHLFRAHGLVKGDHVAMFLENHLRYFELQGAAERCGLYFTCINSYLTSDEVAYIVDNCEAKVFFTSVAKVDVAVEAAAQTPRVELYLCIDATEPIGPFQPYEEAIAAFPPTPIDDEQLGAAMLYSSGTTGRPKGIKRPLTGRNAREGNVLLVPLLQSLYGVGEDTVYLSPAPLYQRPHSPSRSASRRSAGPSLSWSGSTPRRRWR
jgi:long-chain acyl-CoA synthetase